MGKNSLTTILVTLVRVTSAVFPGGEIRGQLLVPAPASIGLLGASAVVLMRRRQVKKTI